MGPETTLATGQPDLNTITTGAPPQVPLSPDPVMQQAPMQQAPMQQPFQVQEPVNFNIQGQQRSTMNVVPAEYGWQPSQADLGQQQVSQRGFAQMGLPHGAIASRQQALAERQQQNKIAQQKLLEKWDPMGGVGKAADPFQPAFAKATTKDFERLVGDWSEILGGRSEAYKFLSGQLPGREAEGLQTTQAWSKSWDAIAQANRGYFERAVDAIAGVDELKAYMSPEDQKVLRGFLTASTPEGLPITGTDPQEYMLQGRRIEGILSKAEFIKNFAKDIPSIVQLEAQKLGKAIPLPGGNYALEDISEKDMEEAVKFYARQYAEVAEMAGIDASSFEQELRLLINDERKRQLKIFRREKPSESSSGGGGATATPMVVPSVVQAPATTSGGVIRGPQDKIMMTPYQTTGDKPHKVAKMNVVIGDQPQDIYAPSLTWDDKRGEFMITGTSISEAEERRVENEASSGWTEPKEGEDWARRVESIVMKNKVGSRVSAPLSTNSDAGRVYWGSANGYDVVANALAAQGVTLTPKEVKDAMEDKEGIKYIQSIFRGQ